MALRKAVSLSDLPAGEMAELELDGHNIVLCHVDGEIHAIGGDCPHQLGPLGQGALHGHTVVCPWHAWEFDCRTGECDVNPSITVPKYRTEVREGAVYIELPERPKRF
jgi:nitrite reductase/ring-hydroxylating ferredoxin subunit